MRVDFADAVVEGVGDVERAVLVDGDAAGRRSRLAHGRVDLRVGGLAAVAGKTGRAIADDGGYGAVEADAADALVFLVGDIHAADRIEGGRAGQVDQRQFGGAVVAAVGAFAGAADRLDIVAGEVVAQNH